MPTAGRRQMAPSYAQRLDSTLHTIAELSEEDVKRRNFLLGAAFTTAAFAEPALSNRTIRRTLPRPVTWPCLCSRDGSAPCSLRTSTCSTRH